jgi:hypothetical protein
MSDIFKNFAITEEEYKILDKDFGRLTHHASWCLIRKNSKNNYTDDQEDINQELVIAMLRAGAYYKRQTYIENCLNLCEEYVNDEFCQKILQELKFLWKNKTRHGASRQKFGEHQEKILGVLVRNYVPNKEKPSKKAPLKIGPNFATYCKSITWNQEKYLGKKITREKSIRQGMASISDYEYLAVSN